MRGEPSEVLRVVEGLHVVGEPRPIRDAASKVTGRKAYVADMSLPGMLVGKLLLSDRAHARVVSVDASRARTMPGVHAVATWEDCPDVRYNSAKRMIDAKVPMTERVLARRVRHVGDRVAAVAAETEEQAAAALKAIEVTYEDLPCALSIDEALDPSATPLHGDSNVVATMEEGDADIERHLAACPHVASGSFSTPPVHQGAIEPHCAIADWDDQGKLTVVAPVQNAFAFRVILAEIFGLTYNRVRVSAPAIGGGFGAKLELTIEPVAALLSRMCGRPVKMVLNRAEAIATTRVRHGSQSRVRVGFDDAGNILAIDVECETNTGAYAGSALNVAGALMENPFQLYRAPHVHVRVRPVYTNTTPAGAMRGYGGPEVYFATERMVDRVAAALGRDPADLRRQNLIGPDALDAQGHPRGNPRPKDCLERACELVHWDEARALAEASRQEGGRFAYGIGVAAGSHGNNCYGVHRDSSSPMIKMNEDGSAVLYTGSHEMGNDTVGTQAAIVSEVVGVPLDQVGVVSADTDTVLWHIGDYASRGTFVVCAAVKRAAELMAAEVRREAALLLEDLGVTGDASADDVVLGDGWAWHAAQPSRRVALREVMTHCQAVSHRELCVHVTYEAPRGVCSYGAHAALVRVDRQTGEVRVERYAAVHDVGRVLNPLMLEGQLEGGVAMGLGYTLSEGVSFAAGGAPRQRTLRACGLPRATDMPAELRLGFVCEGGGEPGGPWGAKALGECPVVPVAPCVANAIFDAVGVDIDELPASPERVLAALAAKGEES